MNAISTNDIDERSQELMKECHQHVSEVCKLFDQNGFHQSAPSKRNMKTVAFEGWIIQKLASIQLLIEAMAD